MFKLNKITINAILFLFLISSVSALFVNEKVKITTLSPCSGNIVIGVYGVNVTHDKFIFDNCEAFRNQTWKCRCSSPFDLYITPKAFIQKPFDLAISYDIIGDHRTARFNNLEVKGVRYAGTNIILPKGTGEIFVFVFMGILFLVLIVFGITKLTRMFTKEKTNEEDDLERLVEKVKETNERYD